MRAWILSVLALTLTLGLALPMEAGPALGATAPITIHAHANEADASLNSFCVSVTQIPGEECDALVTLYNGTDGPNWLRREGWMDSYAPCSWYGVTCAGGHVVGLRLNGNQ